MNIKLTNNSKYPTDELMPLLRLAWNTAVENLPTPPQRQYALRIGVCRTSTWNFRWTTTNYGDTSATICFAKPGKGRFPVNMRGIQLQDINETVVALAAWTFICQFRRAHLAYSVARDAVEAYRKQNIATKVEAVRAKKKERESMAWGKMVLDDMESKTLDFKLARIERAKKVWMRKLKLATTKLRTLRRRESALKAADKRRQSQETLVNTELTA